MSATPEILVLTDLDDSLFSTLRKIPEAHRKNTTLAAQAAAGAASGKNSFMSAKQAAMVQWMDLSRCVPVTARGSDAYSRVTLPFAGPAAILANGAVMLNRDGTVNEAWARHVIAVLSPLQKPILALPGIMKQLAAQRSLDVRSWAVMEPSCGAVYAVAKSNDSSSGDGLSGLRDDINTHFKASDPDWAAGWRFHINGNNLSVTPANISKAHAVAHLLKRLRKNSDILTLGVGDSASDLEFMRLCDVWLTPTGSQLDQLLP